MSPFGSLRAPRLVHRLTGFVLLPALAVAVGGPLLHGCPHHDDPAPTVSHQASAAQHLASHGHAGGDAAGHGHAGSGPAGHGHPDHADHDSAGPHPGAHNSEDAHAPEHDAPCTCIGSCHGSSLAPHPAAMAVVVRQAAAPTAVVAAAGAEIPAPPSEYLLPYPNGPPGTL